MQLASWTNRVYLVESVHLKRQTLFFLTSRMSAYLAEGRAEWYFTRGLRSESTYHGVHYSAMCSGTPVVGNTVRPGLGQSFAGFSGDPVP